MNINDENINVRQTKNIVRQSDVRQTNDVRQNDNEQCQTQEYPIISDVRQSKNDVRQSDDDVRQSNVRQIAKLDIRMPQKLKDEIHRQAEELGMSTSSLAKAVLAQAFIK